MRILWEESAWEDYCCWQVQDKKTLKRINALLKDYTADAYAGIGKPEPLKNNLSGFWSRRILTFLQIKKQIKRLSHFYLLILRIFLIIDCQYILSFNTRITVTV